MNIKSEEYKTLKKMLAENQQMTAGEAGRISKILKDVTILKAVAVKAGV